LETATERSSRSGRGWRDARSLPRSCIAPPRPGRGLLLRRRRRPERGRHHHPTVASRGRRARQQHRRLLEHRIQGGGGGASNIECKFFDVTANVGAVLPGSGHRSPIRRRSRPVRTSGWCAAMSPAGTSLREHLPWDPANPTRTRPSAEVLAQMAANGMVLPNQAFTLASVWWRRPGEPAGLAARRQLVHDLCLGDSRRLTANGRSNTGPSGVEHGRRVGHLHRCRLRLRRCVTSRPGSSTCSYTTGAALGCGRTDLPQQSRRRMASQWSATNGQGGDLGELSSPVVASTCRSKSPSARGTAGG